MRRFIVRFLTAGMVLASAGLISLAGDPPIRSDASPIQPPPASPIQTVPATPPGRDIRPMAPTQYDSGDVTDDEQFYLELMNRARANPTAEGIRLANPTDAKIASTLSFFGVDLVLMQSQFAGLNTAPPLAMNAQLLTAARLHSGDMLTNQYQGHTGTDGSSPGTRVQAAGYPFLSTAENVYATSFSTLYGHFGFEVDWGVPPTAVGGMQNPPGHRINIHNAALREVGVGVVNGVNGGSGPQVVTQDFGTRQAATPLLLGAAYYDFNTNGFDDLGEGLGGVTVSVSGASFYAVTVPSGGFTVPVPGNGTYTVTFLTTGIASVQKTVTVIGSQNVKVDFTPAYEPPTLSGPSGLAPNTSGAFTISAVAGAVSYQYESSQVQPLTAVDGADNGFATMTPAVTSGYNVITNRPGGPGKTFHLAHFSNPSSQILTVTRTILPRATSSLQFDSRLGFASTNQVAKVQVSTDQGASWSDVYSQAGTYSSATPVYENSFSTRSVSLASFSGQPLLIRFAYTHQGGIYYSSDQSGTGWYVDNIAFTDMDETIGAQITSIPSGATFNFTQASLGESLLRARALLPGRTLPFGPLTRVSAQAAVIASPKFGTLTLNGAGDFFLQVTSATAGKAHVLETSTDLKVWTPASTNIPSGNTFTAQQPASLRGSAKRFYRVTVQP